MKMAKILEHFQVLKSRVLKLYKPDRRYVSTKEYRYYGWPAPILLVVLQNDFVLFLDGGCDYAHMLLHTLLQRKLW